MIYVNRNIKKVSEKDDLKRELDTYKSTLNEDIIKYLDHLIDLDFNVVREDIDNDSRSVLNQLELYRDIAIYNIYHRSNGLLRNLFEDHSLLYKMRDNKDNIEGIRAYLKLSGGDFEVFNFDYSRGNDILLYKLCAYTPEEKQEKMNKILSNLERLYDEKNPYPDPGHVYGGPYASWGMRHMDEIDFYERKFRNLDERKLTEEDRRDIELTSRVYDYIASEFDLKDDDLEESAVEMDSQKTYVKSISGINIKKNIKYI